jgi:hypothetical protein
MSAFYQLQNITYDRGSLTKDDRADAIQGLVMHLSELLVVDDEKQQQKRLDEKERSFIANPMEYRKEQRTARGVMVRVRRR